MSGHCNICGEFGCVEASHYGNARRQVCSFCEKPFSALAHNDSGKGWICDQCRPRVTEGRDMKEALDLIDYIELHHSGNQAAFGRAQDVKPQQVTKWLDMGCVVLEGVLYSPRRELNCSEL